METTIVLDATEDDEDKKTKDSEDTEYDEDEATRYSKMNLRELRFG